MFLRDTQIHFSNMDHIANKMPSLVVQQFIISPFCKFKYFIVKNSQRPCINLLHKFIIQSRRETRKDLSIFLFQEKKNILVVPLFSSR